MNKQNTETETTTRNETLRKWIFETLCNIAILVSGHPEIEDDILEKICEDVESEELLIHAYLESPHSDPEIVAYKIVLIDINTHRVVKPPVAMPTFFTDKDTVYKRLKECEDILRRMGCIGIVKPISKDELGNTITVCVEDPENDF